MLANHAGPHFHLWPCVGKLKVLDAVEFWITQASSLGLCFQISEALIFMSFSHYKPWLGIGFWMLKTVHLQTVLLLTFEHCHCQSCLWFIFSVQQRKGFRLSFLTEAQKKNILHFNTDFTYPPEVPLEQSSAQILWIIQSLGNSKCLYSLHLKDHKHVKPVVVLLMKIFLPVPYAVIHIYQSIKIRVLAILFSADGGFLTLILVPPEFL